MEVKNGSDVILCLVDDLLVISVAKNRKNCSFNTQRGLNNVRNISFVSLGIKVGKILLGLVLMLSQVVVGSVGNAPELAPTEREKELKVGSCLGVKNMRNIRYII